MWCATAANASLLYTNTLKCGYDDDSHTLTFDYDDSNVLTQSKFTSCYTEFSDYLNANMIKRLNPTMPTRTTHAAVKGNLKRLEQMSAAAKEGPGFVIEEEVVRQK